MGQLIVTILSNILSVLPSKSLFEATALPIVNAFGVMSADKPVGCVKLYFEASAPFKVKKGVTVLLISGVASA